MMWSAQEWEAAADLTDRLIQLNSVDYPVAYLTNGVAHYNLRRVDASHLRKAEGSLRVCEQLARLA
jgi:hypothetical protein